MQLLSRKASREVIYDFLIINVSSLLREDYIVPTYILVDVYSEDNIPDR